MPTHFENHLEGLKGRLIYMASLAMSNIFIAVKTLTERSDKYSEEIFAQEECINSLQIEIDNSCLELLALYQPVATDLRFLTSSMKISSDLERIGDQAVNITQAAAELAKYPLLKPLIDIPRMAEIVQRMVKDSVDAFIKRDSQLARDVLQRDDLVDELKDRTFSELLEIMSREAATIPRAMQLILVSRNLERVADHATNIAEDVIYLVEARDVRHHSENS
jgi:phosphate transport system protein